jgi:hypothetical protein
MKTGLSLLEEWYAARCDGDWEHSWGVKIDTLDNPGWTISINLNDTRAESRNLERLKIVRTENDWIHYWVEKRSFQIRCGPLNLTEAVEIFVTWFNS